MFESYTIKALTVDQLLTHLSGNVAHHVLGCSISLIAKEEERRGRRKKRVDSQDFDV